MGAKWFGGIARFAIVASAVACNSILGIQDLPADSSNAPQPFDGGSSLRSCKGKVYMTESGDSCGCTGGTFYALCNANTYSQCSCTVPAGYKMGSNVPDDAGKSPGDDGGFEDATGFEDFDAGFDDVVSFEDDASFFEDDAGFFDGGGFEDDAGFFDAGGFEDATGIFDASPPPPPPLDASGR
jgi:hypothetical protein